MKKRILFIVLTVLMVFLACVSTQQSSTDPSDNEEDILPGWVVSPRVSDIGFFGIGYAKKATKELSIEAALKNARADVSKQLYKKIKSTVVDYAKEKAIDVDSKKLRNFYDALSESITNKYIKVSRTNLYQEAGNGIWLEVLYEKGDFSSGVRTAVRSINVEISGFNKEELAARF